MRRTSDLRSTTIGTVCPTPRSRREPCPADQLGATVTLTYDLVHNPDWPDPDDGDWLVSYSERTETWGTAYLIIGARQVRSEINPRRFSLRCRKVGPMQDAGIEEGDRVFPIVWYPRGRRKR